MFDQDQTFNKHFTALNLLAEKLDPLHLCLSINAMCAQPHWPLPYRQLPCYFVYWQPVQAVQLLLAPTK